VSQLLSAPAIQFKGSGWYVTEYGKMSENQGPKKTKPTEKANTAETKAGESSTTPSESKPPSDKDSKKPS
jgi:predicted nucleic acid-binding Zn ribbon protein